MKKIFVYFSIFVLLTGVFIYTPIKAETKTLGQLLNELNALEQNLKDASNEKKLTEERLNEITTNMVEIGLRINEIENTIIDMQKQVEDMNEEIESRQKQIRKLASLMQKNDIKTMYLEFLFGSDTLVNFIYRLKAIEQITTYNDKLVEELHELIDKSKQKSKDLEQERESLEEENDKLVKEQEELGSKINVLDEDARDLLEDIAAAKITISNYQKMGCKDDDTLEKCSVIPADATFLRPLVSGFMTSGYGTRDNPVSGGYQFHAAVDIGGNRPGTSVYAAASGVVVLAYHAPTPNIPNSSCGGNFVVIQHQINGQYYATRYMHLSQIYVTENQRVTSSDIIGAVGGGESYDRCSTGPHLDFSIAKGIYGRDFYAFRQPNTVNPYTLMNLPPVGGSFASRYIKY